MATFWKNICVSARRMLWWRRRTWPSSIKTRTGLWNMTTACPADKPSGPITRRAGCGAGCGITRPRRSAAHRHQYRQAAGATEEGRNVSNGHPVMAPFRQPRTFALRRSRCCSNRRRFASSSQCTASELAKRRATSAPPHRRSRRTAASRGGRLGAPDAVVNPGTQRGGPRRGMPP